MNTVKEKRESKYLTDDLVSQITGQLSDISPKMPLKPALKAAKSK